MAIASAPSSCTGPSLVQLLPAARWRPSASPPSPASLHHGCWSAPRSRQILGKSQASAVVAACAFAAGLRQAQVACRPRYQCACEGAAAAPPKRRRRRRKEVPQPSSKRSDRMSEMLTLNTCDCNLILDTVIEIDELLTPEQARVLLDAARATAEQKGWGGAASEGKGKERQLVKVKDLLSAAAKKIFEDFLIEPMAETISEYFELPQEDLKVEDAAIVRYATDAVRKMPAHRDGSIVSAIISLSSETDYVGGGTEFQDGSVYRPAAGGAIVFGGQRLHSGAEIFRGARYICTVYFKCGGLSCRELAVQKDKEEEGDPGIWGGIRDLLGANT
eukprot:TRINITY_DN51860_c0_g1_i1.p1 TRINITY_DN51860_c0_g1~~TRINITY_DN51860_c0_g1_i1.p1  ORF type:complete len:332 (-),score=73.57 TRINITY_DN51860_c0_g1_i1:66-1061(-)